MEIRLTFAAVVHIRLEVKQNKKKYKLLNG